MRLQFDLREDALLFNLKMETGTVRAPFKDGESLRWALSAHLDDFALVGADRGRSSSRGGGQTLRGLGQREGEGGDQGGALAQEAVHGFLLLHRPIGCVPLRLPYTGSEPLISVALSGTTADGKTLLSPASLPCSAARWDSGDCGRLSPQSE